jgi:hypothetical protein
MKDLFETPELIPDEVGLILETLEEGSYEDIERILKEIKPLGYTFEYYLDAVPYGLRKIKNKTK